MTAPLDPVPPPTGALALDTLGLTKRFGAFTALDEVTMSVAAGSVHALLGENGAGKSTLVKCVAGSQRAEEGSLLVDGRERDIASPVVARALGIGMVYQHFTLAPGMTVAENLLLAGGRTKALIDWKQRAPRAGRLPGDDALHASTSTPRRRRSPPARSRSSNCSSSSTCGRAS